jgi:hypothetical protein
MQVIRRASVVLFILSAARGAAWAEPRVELETFVGGGGTALGGGGRIGVPLGQRLVLMAGVEGQGAGEDDYTAYWVRIPGELKVYLTRPRPGGLAPQIRLGAAYIRSGSEGGGASFTARGIEGLGALGISYLVSERFGLGADVGLSYGHYSVETDGPVIGPVSEGWQLGLSWRVGMLFRI